MADVDCPRFRYHEMPRRFNERGYTKGAEIGTCSGRFAAQLLNRCPGLELTCVDFWPPEYAGMDGTVRGAKLQNYHRDCFMKVLRKFEHRLALIEKPSLEAAKEVEDGSLDFVFIDADHSYEGCKADIEAWAPKVRKGGMVTGHDYRGDFFPGVIKAVDEIYPKATILDDSLWLVDV